MDLQALENVLGTMNPRIQRQIPQNGNTRKVMAEEMEDIHRDNNFKTSYLGNDWPEKEGENETEVCFEKQIRKVSH